MLYALWNQIFCSLLILPEYLQLLIHIMYIHDINQFLTGQISLPQDRFGKEAATYSLHLHTYCLLQVRWPMFCIEPFNDQLLQPSDLSQGTHKVQVITQAPHPSPSPKHPGICTPSELNKT